MTKLELSRELDGVLQEMVDELKLVAPDPYSKEPVTQGDLFESNRQIFYTLHKFKDTLLEYLD